MPSVQQILRMRQVYRQKTLRSPLGRLGLGSAALLSLLTAFAALALAAAYVKITRDLPNIETLQVMLDPPGGSLLQPTRFYDRTGEQILLSLEHPAAAQKQYLPYDLIPTSLISATIANVDPGFWQNPGFSLAGVFQRDRFTIAQRLVSDLVFWDEPAGLRRALREGLFAAQITARFGREQVLTWYLNSVPYGRLAFGADAASRAYFGKPASQLNLAESALLTGIAQAPALDPLDTPQLARKNQERVLQRMLDQGLITPDQAEEASLQVLDLTHMAEHQDSIAPAFLYLVLEELALGSDLNRIERGGLRIITTLEYNLQTQAVCAAQAQTSRLVKTTVEKTASPCPAAQLLPTLAGGEAQADPGLEAGAVVMDPASGQVLALADSVSRQANIVSSDTPSGYASLLGLRPLQAHAPGSLLTPFIYFTAFTRGWSPASLVWDIPLDTGPALRSAESLSLPLDNHIHQGPMRLRLALANDFPAPVLQILDQVGADNISRTTRQFGLSIPALSSIQFEDPLNGGEITLLQAAQAFSVFANQGNQAGRSQVGGSEDTSQPNSLRPITFLRVEDMQGRPWGEAPPVEHRPITSPQLTYLITHILSDETARRRSPGQSDPLEVGRPAAVKQGRSSTGVDHWTVGYTPQFVVGVWLGYPETSPSNRSRRPVSPENSAALWQALFQTVVQAVPPLGWTTPPDIITQEVCDPSGMLPTQDCPNAVREVFIAGSEPVQEDTLYRRLEINRETGRLATIFTPPAQVEERVFLITPPEAARWAEEAGLPAPPDTYDVILGPLSTSPGVQISSPGMFNSVSGEVSIRGEAAGDGFISYRLQVGAGLNPHEWVQIGQGFSKPVEDGQLGLWDTRGLGGLYALQLLVLRESQRVDTAVIQLTVDNEPPKLDLTYPGDGQVFHRSEQDLVIFQASAVDDLGLESVEFFVDGRSIREQAGPPYAVPWDTLKGAHTLQVVAADRAGNTSRAAVEFVVK